MRKSQDRQSAFLASRPRNPHAAQCRGILSGILASTEEEENKNRQHRENNNALLTYSFLLLLGEAQYSTSVIIVQLFDSSARSVKPLSPSFRSVIFQRKRSQQHVLVANSGDKHRSNPRRPSSCSFHRGTVAFWGFPLTWPFFVVPCSVFVSCI